jgi:hypothetical protein
VSVIGDTVDTANMVLWDSEKVCGTANTKCDRKASCWGARGEPMRTEGSHRGTYAHGGESLGALSSCGGVKSVLRICTVCSGYDRMVA